MYNLSESYERIYLIFQSSEYLYLELRLIRGMVCFLKQKRIFSKQFIVKQLISLDKVNFVLQSFHDGNRYYSLPYIHEKDYPEVFSYLRPLFDLPSAFIREVNDKYELDYWDEICIPFPAENENQKHEYV